MNGYQTPDGTRYVIGPGGDPVRARFHMILGMTWIGWLNFCVLQWFGVRLIYTVRDDGGMRVKGARLRWPMTRWHMTWDLAGIVPLMFSLPVLVIAALVWWWACSM
jgi:hypothetical protein